MEYICIQKNVGHSPRKLRLVADMVRKMTPDRAIETLQFTNRTAAIDFIKAIKTALANGGNNASLLFKKIEVNEGMKMKRYRVGTAGRGRGRPYKRRTSHIKIVLTDEVVTNGKSLELRKGRVVKVKREEIKKVEEKAVEPAVIQNEELKSGEKK